MIIINNYHETNATDESDEEWIEKYYPAMNDSSKRTMVSCETVESNEIKELRSQISALTEQVSLLVSLLGDKEVIR